MNVECMIYIYNTYVQKRKNREANRTAIDTNRANRTAACRVVTSPKSSHWRAPGLCLNAPLLKKTVHKIWNTKIY